MPFTITVPEVQLDEAWLERQLSTLHDVFKDAERTALVLSCPDVEGSEELDDRAGQIITVATVQDCFSSDGNTWQCFCRVVFEKGGIAYVEDDFGSDYRTDNTFENLKDYEKSLPQRDWVAGLVALAKAAATRVPGLTSEDAQQMSGLLNAMGNITQKRAQVVVS